MSEGRKQRYNTASRRSFLGAMLAAAVAPAFVRSSSLMKLVAPSEEIILINPLNFGNMVWRPELVMVPSVRSDRPINVQPMIKRIVQVPLKATFK